MAIVQCSECGKSISNKAAACVGCGAPIDAPLAANSIPDSAAQVNTTAKSIVSDVVHGAKEAARLAAQRAQEALKTQEERDAEAIERIGAKRAHGDLAPIECQRFQATLEHSLDALFAELILAKPDDRKFLGFVDGQIMTGRVRGIFSNALGVVPPQIETACTLSEVVLAPSAREKQRLLKGAVGLGGGAAGIGMVIAAVGGALGWGAGVVASVTAFFVGSSMSGPIGWGVAGLAVAGIAAYFATSSSEATDTERFLKVLKASVQRATESMWHEHGDALSRYSQSAVTA